MKNPFKKIGFYASLIAFCSIVILLYLLVYINAIPMRFIVLLGFILLVFLYTCIRLFLNHPSIWKNIIAWVIIIPLIVTTSFGSWYIYKTNQLLNIWSWADDGTTIDQYVGLYVSQESTIEQIDQLDQKKVGVYQSQNDQYSEKMIDYLQKNKVHPTYVHIDSMAQMIEKLRNNEIDAMIVLQPLLKVIEQNEPAYKKEQFKQIISVPVTMNSSLPETKDIDILNEPFTVLILGTNEFGEVSADSANSINILAAIDPTRNKIVLFSLPKEMYIDHTKLNYLGIEGTKKVQDALQEQFDIPIDYSVRVNLTAMVQLVDELGGIDIYNQHDFKVGKTRYEKGNLHLNGEKALEYIQNYPNASNKPNEAEMIVFDNILHQILSSNTLAHFNEIKETLGRSVNTNMNKETIAEFVKLQLLKNKEWTIDMFGVNGTSQELEIEPLKERSKVIVIDEKTKSEVNQKLMKILEAQE
ncbi:hypothetical protein C815_00643 [Firmicutes bacterium M10-2]|nr:hypothetical protein C815_00643 [Firmicutes bacterium M10-2]